MKSSRALPEPFALIFFFFFNDTATTKIYTLSLHDALPISSRKSQRRRFRWHHRLYGHPSLHDGRHVSRHGPHRRRKRARSEEHTSELQSLAYLVCRLLLEKKNTQHVVLAFRGISYCMTLLL